MRVNVEENRQPRLTFTPRTFRTKLIEAKISANHMHYNIMRCQQPAFFEIYRWEPAKVLKSFKKRQKHTQVRCGTKISHSGVSRSLFQNAHGAILEFIWCG